MPNLKALAVIAALSLAACQRSQPTVTYASAPPNISSTAPQSYAPLVARVAPAVVTVHAALRVRAAQQFPFQNEPFFRWFFGNPSSSQQQQQEVEHALGSGVLVRSDGYILTNHHVIDGAEKISVDLSNNRSFPAKLIGSDPLSDLAVLKIDASNLPTLALGDSDKVQVGDVCLAIGNPLGVGETVTNGIVSAKGRTTGLSNGSFEDFLQTDAPINQGNSGGALINTTAELIGINSQILSTTGGFIGIGFAIPSNMARSVMDQLIKSGKVTRGHLGVGIQPLTSSLSSSLGLPDTNGVLINSVEPNGPAEKAGIKVGDVITALNGKPIADANTFRNTIASTPPGSDITLAVKRDGKDMEVRAKLDELKPNQPHDEPSPQRATGGKLGLSVEPMTPGIASQLNLPPNTQGLVVVSVDPMGPAANAGLQTGDVIEEVNRRPVKSINDMQSALSKSGPRPVLLLINRGGQTVFVTINPQAG
jgi:serine protease Do